MAMKFWGAEVKPGKSLKLNLSDDQTLRVTQASLGDSVTEGQRSVITVLSGGQKYIIASLLAGKSEHAVMELMFESGPLEFSVTGKNAVHLAGNMIDDEGDDDEDEEDEDMMSMSMGGGKKQIKMEDEDDDDDDEDEDEDDEEEEDDDEEEDDEEEEESEEEEAPPAKKRPAQGKPQAAPPAKQQKAAGGDKKAAQTPSKGDAKSAPSTPGTPGEKKPISADVKAKVKALLAGQAQGIKGADFGRDWEKKNGGKFGDVFHGFGYKKQGQFLDTLVSEGVCERKGDGSNATYFPKKK